MITTLINYVMAYNLDLFKITSRQHEQYIKDIGELEITAEGGDGYNPYTSHISISYTIKNKNYKYSTYYNTSSIYALYIYDLYDSISDNEITDNV